MSDSPGPPHLVPVPDLPGQDVPTRANGNGTGDGGNGRGPRRPSFLKRRRARRALKRTRVKKLRLVAILLPLFAIAGISTVFGMMMAVASDLPGLEQLPQVAKRKNSTLYDVNGKRLTTLTSNQGRIIVDSDQIGAYTKHAVIAIEDRRFYENSGVDLRGIGRAFVQDVVQGRQAQGASTIAQQFVKNALQAQAHRTVFEKLREAALAYHLTRKWSKDRILTEYLNSVYFGNGAYGIEAAARTYFGSDPNHEGCGIGGRPMCADQLTPAEAALLAGIIASPSGYDPVAHYDAAIRRRNIVLKDMLDQRRITYPQYQDAVHEQYTDKPKPPEIKTTPASAAYFVSWVRQSLVDQVGPQRAFEGNLRVRTTLDTDLQEKAVAAIRQNLQWAGGPTASLVAIDNKTGEVRAMVGGSDYDKSPFNLATQGQRQPGSSIKPFILAEALRQGISPAAVLPSRKRVFRVRGSRELFVVNNFDNEYAGQSTIANALTFSDNAVFAALGIRVGTRKVARLAERMGIRTPVSSNLAMTLGGLSQGVTPLDMAHAYETFAAGGKRITGTLGTADSGPVGIHEIDRATSDGKLKTYKKNKVVGKRVLSAKLAAEETQLLTGPVKFGTATRAQYGGFAAGKTGTTENSGDAWFVGFTDRWTIAVWVGYPQGFRPMTTEFQGGDVTGGTYPAMIWRSFVLGANAVLLTRKNDERERAGLPPLQASSTVPSTTAVSPTAVPREGAAPQGAGTTGGSTGGTDGSSQAPVQTTPNTTTPPAQQQTPAAPQTQTTPNTATPPAQTTPSAPSTGAGAGGGTGGTGATGGVGAG
jgi:penicillin-binding protein 1A